MDETRGITVKVLTPLHTMAKQEAEEKEQTMSQFIEMVLQFYFDRKDDKEMSGNKRTLAFQVSEEFFNEVQNFIKAKGMKLKDFGPEAMRRMMDEVSAQKVAEASSGDSETGTPPEQG